MATERIILIGAGGHARVVLDTLLLSGVAPERIAVRDARAGGSVLMLTATAPEIDASMAGAAFHIAIGNAEVRERLFAAAIEAGGTPLTIVHPRATVSPFATLERGSFVAASAVVAPGASVGEGVIVNHGAIVDHDCAVGDFAHIAPNATLGGAARVGARSLIGAGAAVLPAVAIGMDTIVGAGSVVTLGIAGGTWIGAPARRVKD
jgi:sugar O-acyltransferase (sialic acid O-acetyltransferase NeuD family)